MYDDNDNSTGKPEKYTKEQFQKMEKERVAKEMESFIDKRSPESKAAAEQRMKEYKEGKAKSMEEFNSNMQRIGEGHDAKIKEITASKPKGGGGGSGAGDLEMSGMNMRKPKPTMKKGGKVSSASKRADGIAIRGKTRA